MKKDKTNLKIIVAVIVSVILSSSVAVFATIKISATEIGYNNTTVADQLDSLYQTMFSNNYSTEEKQVGKWIDGKPLYQKTLMFSSLNLTAGVPSYVGNTSGLNLDYADVTNISLVESGYHIGETEIKVWIRQPNGNFGVESVKNRSGDLYVTIQYTKTTDQPITD